MGFLQNLLIAILFIVYVQCGEVNNEGQAARHIMLTADNANEIFHKNFRITLRDKSEHLVSLSRIEDLTMLICKMMMEFMDLRNHVPGSGQPSAKFDALERELSMAFIGPRVMDLESFANMFALTMPFPDPDIFSRFDGDIDPLQFTTMVSSSEYKVNLQALMWYIDDIYAVCRVMNTMCKYALGVFSLCVRPRYGDLGSVLSDPSTTPFREMDALRARASVPGRVYQQPADFISWIERLSALRKSLVHYLEFGGRLEALTRVCRQARFAEAVIKKNVSDYNEYLDTLEKDSAKGSHAQGALNSKRKPLFIHSVPLDDVYRDCPAEFERKIESLKEEGEPTVLLLMQNLKERGGVLPQELRARRAQFWTWLETRRHKTVAIDVGGLCDKICAHEMYLVTVFLQAAFGRMRDSIDERLGKYWLKSSLYDVEPSSCIIL
ncbi:hypothetical protein THOM_0085 [Trachipleistophora hominis]|uniref:Uncharacterized protein n=1 Tax=Trachipleistophora hominis TaxID=72359 RepID=L7JZM3_TRAHO|nr:hypothetical protein THOM_0085 [Trachipleistophora hominis]